VNDALLYAGRRVIVTGAASGPGAATAEILVGLGAEVHAIDVENPAVSGLASFTPVDLREPAQIESGVAKIGSVVNALFNCSGLPSTFPGLDVMLVNFCGLRALTEAVIPLMIEGSAIASIASSAGIGWAANLELVLGLLGTPDFAGARAWCDAHPGELAGSDALASEAVNAYTAFRSFDLAPAGVRINCVNPGPTGFPAPTGRSAGAAGPVWPLILLNSPRAVSVTGQRLDVDGLGHL
jgi:NAD(P)-dependent dehydrogenase (short-subunit alcohol dehydrogenase family)